MNVSLFNAQFGFYTIPKMAVVNINDLLPQMTLVDVFFNYSITHFLFSNLLIYHLIGIVIHGITHLYFTIFRGLGLLLFISQAKCFDY